MKLIGGVFGLETTISDADRNMPSFLSAENLFFVNGTSAMALLIRHLQPRQVWLPSYLCVALPIAARYADAAACFYPVDYDLEWRSPSWLEEVGPGDAVIMIRYFGFPISAEAVGMVRSRGAIVIEDATQALFSEGAGQQGDFAIFSPRKFLGVPDGGILVLNQPLDLPEKTLTPAPTKWWLKAFNAAVLRRQFDIHGGERDWFKLFQDAEAHAPVGAFRMSELSRILLAHCFDYDAIRHRRQANFDTLAASLTDIALFTARPHGTVPLGFPIHLKERDRIREELFDHGIYPPVHWELSGLVPETFVESHRLSSEIMTLPCDQRYEQRDMERTAVIVRSAIGRTR